MPSSTATHAQPHLYHLQSLLHHSYIPPASLIHPPIQDVKKSTVSAWASCLPDQLGFSTSLVSFSLCFLLYFAWEEKILGERSIYYQNNPHHRYSTTNKTPKFDKDDNALCPQHSRITPLPLRLQESVLDMSWNNLQRPSLPPPHLSAVISQPRPP